MLSPILIGSMVQFIQCRHDAFEERIAAEMQAGHVNVFEEEFVPSFNVVP
jgi:hypothetical protein